ncbi:major centromere autoantigen B [Puntigrus tetrazona]|uniref:major centromere autoantigen B n=1 Tax=Puntigrus tetrazona TaxID=1606681 RepID=UPI001C8A94DD|nr:major centromere autoantigen B [Puntigrus tetrazona]
MATRKYLRRSIQERKRLLEKYDQLPPMSKEAAARLLNISGSLLCIWLRKRNIKNGKSNLPRTVFPSRKTPRVEAAVLRWIDASRENGITVDDVAIRKKATLVAREMGLCGFRASTVWLARFKTRETVIRAMFRVGRKTGDATKEPKPGNDNKAAEPKSSFEKKTHQIEAALWRWIDQSRESGVSVNESTVCSKAARLARTVGFCNFRANTDWFARFKSREGVVRQMFRIGANNRPSDDKALAQLVPRMDLTSAETRQLEAALWRWIDRSRENGVVTDQTILSEATRLARMAGFGNFRASADWLSRFKTREKVVREMFQLDRYSGDPQSDQTERRSASDQVTQRSDKSSAEQSGDESDSLPDLDIPKLEPTVVTAELDGGSHAVTVPSLWQMREAMKTLATGLLYRGFCDFKLLHQFEKEVDAVLRRSVALRAQNGSQA